MYKVVTIDQFGLNVTQEDGLKNSADAQKEAKECIERWGDDGQDFWVEPYEPTPHKESRVYSNNNAVDGWEDIYPSEEY